MRPILVVDDQPDAREVIRAILETNGFEVVTVASGAAALEALDKGLEAEAVLLDVQMPVLDGWATLNEIRRRYGDLGPRVLMCSVQGDPEDLRRGWLSGCDGYVWKPFDLEALVEELRVVAERADGERGPVRVRGAEQAERLSRNVG